MGKRALTSDTELETDWDDSSAEPGVWRYAMATRMRVIVDAEAYFDLMQQAMLKARSRILLIGWDFDTRIHLTHGRRWWQKAWKREFPARLGSFIPWLVRHNRGLEFRILKWGLGIDDHAHARGLGKAPYTGLDGSVVAAAFRFIVARQFPRQLMRPGPPP